MSVHQLKDGRWFVKYGIGKNPDNPDGTRTYCGRGPEGERAAHALNISLGLGVRQVARSPLFVEMAEAYLAARQGIVAASTAARWMVRMKRVILPAIGELMAHEITHEALDSYVAKRARTVKRTTIHRELTDIRSVVRWAVRRRLISSSPMEGYEMPKLDNARIRPPSRAEIEAILKHAVPHLQRAILISYNTGLRPGREELLTLTWSAVDFIGRTITVTSAVKGGLEERTVPISASFAETLGQWHDEDSKKGARYIIHYCGARVDSLKTAWKNAKARARISRRLRMYDIRHAFATTLLERGGDLKTVSELLGHRSPDLTLKVYQHVSGNLKRQTVSLLDDIGNHSDQKTDTQPAKTQDDKPPS